MKNCRVWFAGLVFVSSTIKAQYYYYNDKYYENAVVFELGTSAGIMNSFTDLGGKKGVGKRFIKDLNWKNTRPCGSLFISAIYQYAVGLRLEITQGSVQGADSILKSVGASTLGRYERNLSFKSRITDLQLSLELHPLFLKNYENEPPRISPYAIAGIGFFSFDPKAMLNGQWHSLQPLRTEGQGFREYPDRKEYELQQVNFPVGMGVRYEINPMLNARLELIHRILRTDYLDDVSTSYIDPQLFKKYLPGNQIAIAQQLHDRQAELNTSYIPVSGAQRGNPNNNDSFFSIQLKIGMRLIHKR